MEGHERQQHLRGRREGGCGAHGGKPTCISSRRVGAGGRWESFATPSPSSFFFLPLLANQPRNYPTTPPAMPSLPQSVSSRGQGSSHRDNTASHQNRHSAGTNWAVPARVAVDPAGSVGIGHRAKDGCRYHCHRHRKEEYTGSVIYSP